MRRGQHYAFRLAARTSAWLRPSLRTFRRYQHHDALPPSLSDPFLSRARSIAIEHASLTSQLASGYDASIAKRAADLHATSTALASYDTALTSISELQSLLHDPSTDAELRLLASEEIETTQPKLTEALQRLRKSLIPVHSFAHLPCMLELRPGVGGSEASIFAYDLLNMYTAWCRRHGLRVSVISLNKADSSVDAVDEAILEIENEGAYGMLRCEAGVHRVQRVPATEAKGRTHTSAVGVLVMPSFPENSADNELNFMDPNSDYYVNPADVKVDVMRAQGAGGQHVNTTDSRVRVTHLPTKIVVNVQESRSQLKNREQAWKILRSRIAQLKREERDEEIQRLRVKAGAVSGKLGRSDKVRTYNWGQQRCTDHRSGLSTMILDDVLEGGTELDKVMKSVREWMSESELEAMQVEEEMKGKHMTKRRN